MLDRQPLKQRVTAFWEARIQGDDLKAYTYEAYALNGKMTAQQYVSARAPTLIYKTYSIDVIDKHENKAQVKVDVQYRLIMPGFGDLPLSMKVDEPWVRMEDGQWYRQLPTTVAGQGLKDQG